MLQKPFILKTASQWCLKNFFEYDHRGRLKTQTQAENHFGSLSNHEVIVANTYDALGNLIQKAQGGSKTNPLQVIDYQYNIRGWLKQINDPSKLDQ